MGGLIDRCIMFVPFFCVCNECAVRYSIDIIDYVNVT